jgi:N-acyl-phosphatidylethanolamine-hydrolysing phospholipase D
MKFHRSRSLGQGLTSRLLSGRRKGSRFENLSPEYFEPALGPFLKLLKSVMMKNARGGLPPMPLAKNDPEFLKSNRTEDTVTWVGHSTVLIQVEGRNILTDPIWSDRAGPLPFAGSRRYTPPGLAFEDLPRIDAVLVSHDHYDHLDLPTVRRLAEAHDPLFLVPLGLAAWFRHHGMEKVVERDWWDSCDLAGLEFHCLPAQHFSRRGLVDHMRRLWCSWSIRGRVRSIFFSGDTGYFEEFKAMGRRLGPFDLALLPIGAYLPPEIMKPVHMGPAEALEAARDLGARVMIPIHWGTYILALDYGDLPVRELHKAAARDPGGGPDVWVLRHGATRIL